MKAALHPGANIHLLWSGAAYAMTALMNFGLILFMAQYVSPADMAIVFISTAIKDMMILFVENGMGSYVIQAGPLSAREQSSLFVQGAATGVLFALLLIASGPWLAAFFQAPLLELAMPVTAGCVLLIALMFPQKSLLQKKAHFRQIALAEFWGMVCSVAVTVLLVLRGHGVMGYLYGLLTRQAVELMVVWTKEPWLPAPVLDKAQVRRLLRYGTFASNASVFSYAIRLIDTVIVGRLLGTHALGLYSLASTLVFLPVSKAAATFRRVVITTFSEVKGELPQLRTRYFDALGKLLFLMLPALACLFLFIPDFINLFFPPDWQLTSVLVRILLGYGLATLLLMLGEPLLYALARVRTMFIINGCQILLTTMLLWVLTPNGVASAAWAMSLGTILPLALMIAVMRSIGILTGYHVRATLPPILLALGGLVITAQLLRFAMSGLEAWVRLIGPLAIAGLVYIAIWRKVKPAT